MKNRDFLMLAAYSNIAYLVVYLASVYEGFVSGFNGVPLERSLFLIMLSVLSVIFGVIYTYGFVVIAKKFKLELLKNVSYLLILSLILSLILDFSITADPTSQERVIFTTAMLFITGILGIFWGVGILPLDKKFGQPAKVLGILSIITGAMFATIFLVSLGGLLIVAVNILEIMILFKASRIIKN